MLLRDRSTPDPNCDECRGTGETFGHAADCKGPHCALAGGVYDCDGVVFACTCWDDPDACIGCGEAIPDDAIAKGWRSATSETDMDGIMRCPDCQRDTVDGVHF